MLIIVIVDDNFYDQFSINNFDNVSLKLLYKVILYIPCTSFMKLPFTRVLNAICVTSLSLYCAAIAV